jgi:hypothetical protein
VGHLNEASEEESDKGSAYRVKGRRERMREDTILLATIIHIRGSGCVTEGNDGGQEGNPINPSVYYPAAPPVISANDVIKTRNAF